MARQKLPWFPFCPIDFLTDEQVLQMNLQQVGIYLKLLCHQWIEGSIPADPLALQAMLGVGLQPTTSLVVSDLLAICSLCFQKHPRVKNRLINPRMYRDQIKQSASYQRVVEGGRRGGLSRVAQASLKPGSSHPQAIRNRDRNRDRERKEEEKSVSALVAHGGVGFEMFWASYPKKVGKDAALKVWQRIHPDEALQQVMVARVLVECKNEQWCREDGRFIPHASTWLHQKRWQDEPTRVGTGPARSVVELGMRGKP